MPFEGVGPKGQLRVERALLERYLAPLGVPPRATKDPVDVQVFGLPDGSGWGLSFELTEPVLAALARFDLTRRYGAYADYVRSVRAWGDGTHWPHSSSSASSAASSARACSALTAAARSETSCVTLASRAVSAAL